VRQAAPAAGARARSFDEGAGPLDLHATEKRLISQALATTKGNITAAARKLGISRRTLHRKLNEMSSAEQGGGKSEIRITKSEIDPNDQNSKFKTAR
jgi:DNA-binding NtrC family response regulator